MEELTGLLKRYGRFLELEDNIPHWEGQCPELRERIGELKLSREQKKWDLEHLEAPNFFRRIFGKAEEKKEKIAKQLGEVSSALTAAQWELEALEKKIEEGRQELQALSGSRETYAKAKQEAVLTSIQEGRLMMEELAAFTPAAIAAADRVLEALEDARIWMQQDAIRKGISGSNRKMECLSLAAENARRLREIIGIMPEGCAGVGSYLLAPDGYIDAVTSEYGKLDRLNSAIEQVRETRNQLRMLQ